MDKTESILEKMCRACLCKNRKLCSLYDVVTDRPFTILAMFATTLPHLAIHNNDELSKVICTACFNTLIMVHKFQQMCTASDAYMRNLLTSRSPTNFVSMIEQPADEPHAEATNLDYFHVLKEDPLELPRAINKENHSPEICENSDEKDKSADLCDISESDRNYMDVNFELSSFDDSDADPDWSAKSDSGCQEKIEVEICEIEPKHTSISIIDIGENQIYKIEKPHSQPRRKYRFRCENCNAGFNSNYKLKQHSDVHLESRKFVCETCSYRFETSKSLSRHICVEHEISPPEGHKCPKCPRRFQMRKSLTSHMSSHRYLKCNWCTKQFGKMETMEKHVRKHLIRHKKKPISDREVVSEVAVLEGIDDAYNNTDPDWSAISDSGCQEKSIREVCKTKQNKTIISSKNTIENEKYEIEKPHSQPRRKYHFRCEHCNAGFNSNYKLKQHSDVHLESRKFVCETCSYRFETSKSLSRHISIEHEISPPEGHKCPKCPRRFQMQKSLTSHMSSHRYLKCNWCTKQFGKMETMVKHVRKHLIRHKRKSVPEHEVVSEVAVSERNDVAGSDTELNTDSASNIQEKSVKDVHKTEQHKPSLSCIDMNENQTYEIEKPNSQPRRRYHFRCKHCNTGFNSNYKLKQHSDVHLESRKFICEICSYRFETSKSLSRHICVEHEISPPEGHKCPKCPRRFEKRKSLTAHMSSHRYLKCKWCTKQFGKEETMQNHLRKHPEYQRRNVSQ